MGFVRPLSLPAGWGRARLVDASIPNRAPVRAYDAEGMRLEWWPDRTGLEGERFACDVEAPRRALAESLASLAPAGVPFEEWWVRSELNAKLLDMPILQWLHANRGLRVVRPPEGTRVLIVRVPGGEEVAGFARCPRAGHPAVGAWRAPRAAEYPTGRSPHTANPAGRDRGPREGTRCSE